MDIELALKRFEAPTIAIRITGLVEIRACFTRALDWPRAGPLASNQANAAPPTLGGEKWHGKRFSPLFPKPMVAPFNLGGNGSQASNSFDGSPRGPPPEDTGKFLVGFLAERLVKVLFCAFIEMLIFLK